MNAAPRFSFAAITDEAPRKAQIITLYGPAKFGKTHFVCTIPKLFIICGEDGLTNIPRPAPHFPQTPRTLGELYQAFDAFAEGNRASRQFNHIAIDSLSWVEHRLQQAARAAIRRRNLDDDYKVGWGEVSGLWEEFFDRVQALRQKAGCHVWLVAHAAQRSESNAAGEQWQKWDLELEGKKAAPLVRKLSDHVLFCNWGAELKKGKKGQRTVGHYTGRLVYFRESADHFAGSRSNAPEVAPLEWARVEAVLTAGAPATPEKLRAQIAAILPELGDVDRADVEGRLAAAKTPRDLAQVLSAAQAYQAAASEQDDEEEAPAGAEPPAPTKAAPPVQPPPREPGDDTDEEDAPPPPALGAPTDFRPPMGPPAEAPPPARAAQAPAQRPPAAEGTDEEKARAIVRDANDAKAIGQAFVALSKLPGLSPELRQEFADQLRAKKASLA